MNTRKPFDVKFKTFHRHVDGVKFTTVCATYPDESTTWKSFMGEQITDEVINAWKSAIVNSYL